jgi:hypothetical protein
LLSISGGTIFNACAEQPKKTESNTSCYGMAVHAGSFAISAVAIRDNRGVGLFVGQDVAGASITGCKIQVRAISTRSRFLSCNLKFTGLTHSFQVDPAV